MKEFWNERYSAEEYVYGTKPNVFFRDQINNLEPGKILLPAEGEGRNAVFAAEKGWIVTAFDLSEQGHRKAMDLAAKKNVEIDYTVSDFRDIKLKARYFDCVALIFAHYAYPDRKLLHNKVIDSLKPGGVVILEAYSKMQIEHNSGGPKDINLLFSKDELKKDFQELSNLDIEEVELELNEGSFHNGYSSIVRMTGVK